MITFEVDEEMAEAILGSYDGNPLNCPRRVKRRLVRQGLAQRAGRAFHLTDYGYQISCDLADEEGAGWAEHAQMYGD